MLNYGLIQWLTTNQDKSSLGFISIFKLYNFIIFAEYNCVSRFNFDFLIGSKFDLSLQCIKKCSPTLWDSLTIGGSRIHCEIQIISWCKCPNWRLDTHCLSSDYFNMYPICFS